MKLKPEDFDWEKYDYRFGELEPGLEYMNTVTGKWTALNEFREGTMRLLRTLKPEPIYQLLTPGDETTVIIGFTGTRNGMTPEQRREVASEISDVTSELHYLPVVLHGDCVGADADFDAIAAGLGCERWSRPCTAPPELRANTGAKQIAEPERPMARNRAIVAQADMMIACPPNFERIKTGSGTWATIGFTEKADKPLVIVFPDGRIVRK